MDTAVAERQDQSSVTLQCAGEHRIDDEIRYCVLTMGHKGEHVDYRGLRWTRLFALIRGGPRVCPKCDAATRGGT